MKRGILLFVTLFFTFYSLTAFSFDEEEIKSKIDEFYYNSDFYHEITDHKIRSGDYVNYDGGRYYMQKTLERIDNSLNNPLSSTKRFIYEHIKQLVKIDLYNYIYLNYGDSTYGPDAIYDIDNNIKYYKNGEELYTNLLDIKFSSYDMLVKVNAGRKILMDAETVENSYNEAINSINGVKGYYDNYDYYYGVYSKYLSDYYLRIGDKENYEKYLNISRSYSDAVLHRKEIINNGYIQYKINTNYFY